jgi:hypothetical protein
MKSVNVGVIVRDVESGELTYRFLPRGAVVRRLWPTADTQIVRHFERALSRTREWQLSLNPPCLGRVGDPSAPEFFAKARREFTGNLQMTPERGVNAESIDAALAWAWVTFVAEPPAAARPINYQNLAPITTRERVWKAFDKRELIGRDLVRKQPVYEGQHAPWTFDLAYENGALHVISSLSLAAGAQANLGRALVYKGMLADLGARRQDVQGIAVVQLPKPEQQDDAASHRAVGILRDAEIETYDVSAVDELAERVQDELRTQPSVPA